MHLDILPDTRSSDQRRAALEEARDGPEARTLLATAIASLNTALAAIDEGGRPSSDFWTLLDEAYGGLDAYLAHLIEAAKLDVRCGPRCSACCTDTVPTMAVEGLRLLRGLKGRSDRQQKIQRAIDHARRFQKMLLRNGPDAADTRSEVYRQTQMSWRRLGEPCPVLADDGNCSAHPLRPLACRVFVSLEDPSHCAPSHPRFLKAERPPIWSHPREHEFEKGLVAISERLGLPPTPNLAWSLARLHEHELL